jgi:hypothetical protein
MRTTCSCALTDWVLGRRRRIGLTARDVAVDVPAQIAGAIADGPGLAIRFEIECLAQVAAGS